MKFIKISPGAYLIKPDVHKDERGFTYQTWWQAMPGIPSNCTEFVQSNRSKSKQGTIRGLHSRLVKKEYKLLTLYDGQIYDVIVDEKTGKHWGHMLTAETHDQLLILPGYFHGFQVYSLHADLEYKISELYDPADQIGVRFDDPALGINWYYPKEAIVSERDRKLPLFKDVKTRIGNYLK